jgi:hypothetical protein
MAGDERASRRRWQRLAFVAVLMLILAGLYAGLYHFQKQRRDVPKDRSVSFGVTVTPPLPGAPIHTMTVHRGDKVAMVIRAEVAGEFHLHGYDREIALKPGATAKLAFKADRSGQFAIELHEPGGAHRDIARLVVEP